MTPAKSERETTAANWPQLVASGGGLRAKLAEKTISFDIPSGISTGRANASSSWSLCCNGLRRAPAPAGRSELGRAARTATGSQRVPLALGAPHRCAARRALPWQAGGWLAASLKPYGVNLGRIAKAGAIMKGQMPRLGRWNRSIESKRARSRSRRTTGRRKLSSPRPPTTMMKIVFLCASALATVGAIPSFNESAGVPYGA